jgi:hypothetical protein
MKRRRTQLILPVNEAAVSPLRRAIAGFSSLPLYPVERAEIMLLSSRHPTETLLGDRVFSIANSTNFSLQQIPLGGLPRTPLEIDVIPVGASNDLEADAAALFLMEHLHFSATMYRRGAPSMPLYHRVSLRDGGLPGVRVSWDPVWGYEAASVCIADLTIAGVHMPSPVLPMTFSVGASHVAEPRGRLLRAADKGDLIEVVAALMDGCSTEENTLKSGHFPGHVFGYFFTPLCAAALSGHFECVAVLLRAGAVVSPMPPREFAHRACQVLERIIFV